MSKFKKISLFLIIMLAVTAVYPFFNFKSDKNVTTASDEIRLTKGVEVKHPALGVDFMTWVEYRDGSYNLYFYNFTIKKEARITTEALSSDIIGPVVYKNFIYWADHTATGWNITKYNVEQNYTQIIRKEDKAMKSLSIYENLIVYEANNDVFVYNEQVVDGVNSLINITNDEASQKAPVIFGNFIAWSEFSSCPANSTSCDVAKSGSVVKYEIDSKIKSTIKNQMSGLSNVQMNNWALAWSELEGSTKVVKIYNYYTRKDAYNISPVDNHSYNPVMFGDSVAYFVSRFAGEDLELFNISSGKRTILSWSKADKKEVAIGPSNRFVAWIDNRLGTNDLYYFDALAEASAKEESTLYPDTKNNTSALKEEILDQDNDGLRDGRENELGTNSFSADTDNDGLTDYEEVVRYHTYPTQYDSDGDGLKDGEEVNNWLSDPLKFDSNNDGIDDKTSVVQGYNPMADRSKLSVYRTIKFENIEQEKQESAYLKRTLNNYLGSANWSVKNQAEWKKISNAYSYGGYNIKEIAAYVRGNKSAISFDTLAGVWREQQELALLVR